MNRRKLLRLMRSLIKKQVTKIARQKNRKLKANMLKMRQTTRKNSRTKSPKRKNCQLKNQKTLKNNRLKVKCRKKTAKSLKNTRAKVFRTMTARRRIHRNQTTTYSALILMMKTKTSWICQQVLMRKRTKTALTKATLMLLTHSALMILTTLTKRIPILRISQKNLKSMKNLMMFQKRKLNL